MPQLKSIQAKATERLTKEKIKLHARKNQRFPVSQGIDFLGYRIFKDHRLLRNDNGHRFARRFRVMANRYQRMQLSQHEINASLASWIAHANHADTWGLRRQVINSVVFSRPGG